MSRCIRNSKLRSFNLSQNKSVWFTLSVTYLIWGYKLKYALRQNRPYEKQFMWVSSQMKDSFLFPLLHFPLLRVSDNSWSLRHHRLPSVLAGSSNFLLWNVGEALGELLGDGRGEERGAVTSKWALPLLSLSVFCFSSVSDSAIAFAARLAARRSLHQNNLILTLSLSHN